MNTSDSSPSRYRGRPLSVLRVTDGSERLHPKPNGPLPDPESYAMEICGPKSERPAVNGSGTLSELVPVTGLTPNFSPIRRIAPPPFGREIAGRGARAPSPDACF